MFEKKKRCLYSVKDYRRMVHLGFFGIWASWYVMKWVIAETVTICSVRFL